MEYREEYRGAGVYSIVNQLNGKIYVGSSKNMFERFRGHRKGLRSNKHSNKHLKCAWDKYGEKNFEFEILQKLNTENRKVLERAEQYWIDCTKCYLKKFGYNNRRNASNNSGYKHTKEAKEKLSKLWRGKKHTEESKRKISESKIGHPVSEETREKLRKINLGRKHTEETKKKIGKAHIGQKHALGFRHTEKAKKKISNATKGVNNPYYGKKHTEEIKNKMRKNERVAQIDPNTGKIIKIHNNCTEASISLGVPEDYISSCREIIRRSARGVVKTSQGFIWKFI